MKLRYKFTLVTTGLIFMLGLGIILFIQTAFRKTLYSEHLDRGVYMAKHFASLIDTPMLVREYPSVQMRTYDFIDTIADYDYIFVKDSFGDVIAHTFKEGVPTELKDMNPVSPGQNYSVQPFVNEKGPMLDIAAPIMEGELGVVHIGLSEKYILKPVNQAVKLVVMITFTVLIFGFVITVVFSRRLTRPLSNLVNATDTIGRGDLNSKVDIRTNDEIGQLSKSFNKMTDDLIKTTVSRDYVDSIVESMMDNLFIVDRNEFIVRVNQATLELLGYREDELVGRPVKTLFADEATEGSRSNTEREGTVQNVEKLLLSKEGRKIPVLLSVSYIQEKSGSVQIVYMTRDITERKNTEEKLKRSKDFVETVLNSIEDSISIINVDDYSIFGCNDKFLREYGLKKQEVLGKHCYEITHHRTSPCTPPNDICPLQETVTTGDHKAAEHIHYDKNGNKIHVLVSTSPIKDKDGKVWQVVHVAKDITKLKEATERAHLMAQHAESANIAKSQFLANMSHEFRTPLNAIIGFSEMLVDGHFGDLNEVQNEYVNDVLTSGRHLSSLVQDILDLSKIEAGKMELDLSEVSITNLLHKSITMVREKALRHGIKISVETTNIPETVICDERKVKQVVFNLLSNAVKFTSDGGEIAIGAETINKNWLDENVPILFREKVSSSLNDNHTSYIRVAIADTGIGMKAHSLEKIFRPFQQEDVSTSRKYGGTGLGLSLCKNILILHKGGIWVESEVGKGTVFSFVIPFANSSDEFLGDKRSEHHSELGSPRVN